MTEPRSTRIRRRAQTIPMMLGATVVAFAGLPVIAPLLVGADLVRGRRRLPRLRLYLFALQYLFNDSVEIVLAPLYWLRAGAGSRLGSPASLRRHRRLQWWSLDLLARRAESLLGLSVELDVGSEAALHPGPIVVVSRHAHLFDASLPALVCGRLGLAVRGVVMAEMLVDPGFDLIYGRLGSVFIPRDDGPVARAEIDAMATSIRRTDGIDVAIGIFPEGRLFSPARRDRLLARLAESDPARAARLAGLTYLLPPRPSGLRMLLMALPSADVVVLDHAGLDDVGSLRDLAARVPLDRSVRVTARRIDRADVPGLAVEPGAAEAFTAWLDRCWLDLDEARAR